ncbi:hypothetical protein ACFQH9_25625 [Pseudonocardia lutea]|uniref:Uncharacterized protein n=1 Tax=Pseudonocardia lutea TaxID=2172015 RepID=A0ABW1ID52_9PSEU
MSVALGGASADASAASSTADGSVSGSTVRGGYGDLPRTTIVPRSIRRISASRRSASSSGPAATP